MLVLCFDLFFQGPSLGVLNKPYNKLEKNGIGFGGLLLHNHCPTAGLMSPGKSKKSLIQEEVIREKGNSHCIFAF